MLKKCVLCSEAFNAAGNSKICETCSLIKCGTCGKSFNITLKEVRSGRKFCSVKCAQSNVETKKKILESCTKSHGGIGFAGDQPKPEKDLSHPETRQKIKNTLMTRYGVENIFQLPAVKAKAQKNKNKKTLDRIQEIKKDLEFRYSNMSLEEKITMSKRDKYYASKLLDIPKEEKDILKYCRQSKATLSRLTKISPEDRKKEVEKQKEGIKKYWEKMSPEEKSFEMSRRLDKRTNSGLNYKATSKINQLWAKSINQSTGKVCLVEQRLGRYIFDLAINDVFIDINPTSSHNSETVFQHLVGLCRNTNCVIHSPLSRNYHNDRVNELYKYHQNDWIFVYDWMPHINVINSIQRKIEKFGGKVSYTEEEMSDEIKIFLKNNIISSRPEEYDISSDCFDETFVSRDDIGNIRSVLTIKNDNESGLLSLVGDEDLDFVKFSLSKSNYKSIIYVLDTNTGPHYWATTFNHIRTVFPEVISDIRRGEITGEHAKNPVKVFPSRIDVFRLK